MDSQGREGEFFRYLQDTVTWVLREPEKLIAHYPLCFHEADQKKVRNANFSLSWEKEGGNYFIGTSEINAGSGIFENSEKMDAKVYNLSDLRTPPVHSSISLERLENEKFLRVGFLFHLLEKQKQKHEVIIAAGEIRKGSESLKSSKRKAPLKNSIPAFFPSA